MEGILFGHEKDAFPGAMYRTYGKFREADGGTLFLDEVGELRQDIQVKILKVLQAGVIEPIGAEQPIKINIRLVVSSHNHLEELMRSGQLREDLYYRLSVFPIKVPLLREREGDVDLLIRYYTNAFASSEGKHIEGVSKEALEMLESYPWPGNVRQLKNAIFRAVVLCEGNELGVNDFPQIKHSVISHAKTPANVVSLQGFAKNSIINIQKSNGDLKELHEIEKEVIACAIAQCEGNLSAVALKLGIGRSTLYRKLYEYGLEPKKHSHTDA
jgi:DNA-binding NtrC family response regulator